MSRGVKRLWAKEIIAVGLFAVVLAGLAVAWLRPRPMPKFTKEQFDKIQVGMTLAEVEAVLGCKPGNHTNDEDLLSFVSRDQTHKYIDWAADEPKPRYTTKT